MQHDIRECLIGELGAVYGLPKTADALADKLAAYTPAHATPESLSELASKIIETRKSRSFPALSELINAVKWMPGAATSRRHVEYKTEADKARERAEAEAAAIRLLRGSALAQRALSERWAVSLLDFVEREGREPGADEERHLVDLAKRNDTLARADNGPHGQAIIGLRKSMHDRARRLLARSDWLEGQEKAA